MRAKAWGKSGDGATPAKAIAKAGRRNSSSGSAQHACQKSEFCGGASGGWPFCQFEELGLGDFELGADFVLEQAQGAAGRMQKISFLGRLGRLFQR
jgi:hypothetical protein